MVLTTSTQCCNPQRDLLTQLMQLNCNWLQHKRLLYVSLLAVLPAKRERWQFTQSHSQNGLLTGTEILTWSYEEVVVCTCVCVSGWVWVCFNGYVWLAKWKEMCIWVMSFFLNPHFLFRYLYPDPPSPCINPLCLTSSLPASVLSLSSICIRNRIWGTMLSYHRSESGREIVRMEKKTEQFWKPRDGETQRKWETERIRGGDDIFFHFAFIHLLFHIRD